jgi:hypothetical protein
VRREIYGTHGLRHDPVAFDSGHGGDIVGSLSTEASIANVSTESFPLVLEVVNFGIERALDVGDRAVSAHDEANFVGGNNGQPVSLEFVTNRLPLGWGRSVSAEIGIGHPFVEGRRGRVIERIDSLVECRFVWELEMYGDVNFLRRIGGAQVSGKLNACRHVGCELLGVNGTTCEQRCDEQREDCAPERSRGHHAFLL